MKNFITKLKENIYSTIIVSLTAILISSAGIGITKIKNLKQDFTNLRDVVYSFKGVITSVGKTIEGTYFIKQNKVKIPAYLKIVGQDMFIIVNDGGAGVYLVGYYFGHNTFYYIDYKGDYITIYKE